MKIESATRGSAEINDEDICKMGAYALKSSKGKWSTIKKYSFLFIIVEPKLMDQPYNIKLTAQQKM